MIKLIIASAMLASTQVYRLELETETQQPYVVGVDGVRRPVCLVDPAEYALMTGRVDQVWRSLNATDSGRRQLHGGLERQEVDEASGVKTDVYKDGFRYHHPMQVKSRVSMRPVVATNVAQRARAVIRDRRFSERQAEMRERLKASRSGAVKEVTVEHDAATGKDIVK